MSNVRKIHFDVILDLDRIEEIQKAKRPDGTYDNYFRFGLQKAFYRIMHEADRGMSDFSRDNCGGCGGGYWEIPEDGVQVRWEIDYLNRAVWWSDFDGGTEK